MENTKLAAFAQEKAYAHAQKMGMSKAHAISLAVMAVQAATECKCSEAMGYVCGADAMAELNNAFTERDLEDAVMSSVPVNSLPPLTPAWIISYIERVWPDVMDAKNCARWILNDPPAGSTLESLCCYWMRHEHD